MKAQSKIGRCSGFSPDVIFEPSLSVTSSIVSKCIDVRDDALDLFEAVAELVQRRTDRLVDDLEHAAAGQQLVFHQRDVGLDAGRVAIHQETDRAGRREDGDLRVAITVFLGPARSARSQTFLASSFR